MSMRLTAPLYAVASTLIVVAPVQAMPMAGTLQGHVDNQNVTPLGGPGDMRIEGIATGSNAGPGTPFDGAKVRWTDTATLKAGQGKSEGVIAFTTPAGTTESPYQGIVSTDAQGRVTVRGKFQTTRGTGDFTGLKGKGTFAVAYSSQTDFTGEWTGTFRAPRTQTSRR